MDVRIPCALCSKLIAVEDTGKLQCGHKFVGTHCTLSAVLTELETLEIAVWTALVRCELAMIGEFGMVLEDFSIQETPVLSISDCGAQITERFFLPYLVQNCKHLRRS